MKKALITLALAASFPLAALAEPSLYGKASLALQQADENGDDQLELVNNNSRIGLRGSEQINDDLRAIYQLEYQTFVDDGGSGVGRTFTQRDIYIGVQGAFGTVIAGKVNSPLKAAQGKVDLFNDLEGDINYLFPGEKRPSNIVQYTSPALAQHFTGTLAVVASEEDNVDNGVSASGRYQAGPLYLALAVDRDLEPGADQVRLVGRYTLGVVHIGALYETYDNGLIDESGALVSALWELSELWALKAQVGESDINFNGGQTLSLGADYKLSDRTKLFGYYTNEQNDTTCGAGNSCESDYLGVGMTLVF